MDASMQLVSEELSIYIYIYDASEREVACANYFVQLDCCEFFGFVQRSAQRIPPKTCFIGWPNMAKCIGTNGSSNNSQARQHLRTQTSTNLPSRPGFETQISVMDSTHTKSSGYMQWHMAIGMDLHHSSCYNPRALSATKLKPSTLTHGCIADLKRLVEHPHRCKAVKQTMLVIIWKSANMSLAEPVPCNGSQPMTNSVQTNLRNLRQARP